MRRRINFYIMEYALNSLLRQKHKSFFISFVLFMLVFLLSSVLFIASSIKYELDSTVDSLPDIIVQKLKGARHYDIDTAFVDEILSINGVESANARVWGYYYFENAGVNFSIMGIDEYEEQYKRSFADAALKLEFSKSSMIVGRGVKRVMEGNYYKEYFNFIKGDGSLKRVDLSGTFISDTELESNDIIVMSKEDVREIFDIDDAKATDIVVKVANQNEVATVASKIKMLCLDCRVITKDDLKISYQNIFDYKSGLFLALFCVALFTFFIIVYDKASGISSEEKKEIGILKAVGWRVDDILRERFYESAIVSVFSYLAGIMFAMMFVYVLKAPLLQEIFTGYSRLKTSFALPFVLDLQTMAVIFFASVPIYMAAVIIPSWRSATLEADEVMR